VDNLPEDQLSRLFQDATRSADTDSFHAQLSSEAPRYEILDELGRGSRKIVHRARDEFTGRAVALATLLPPVDDDKVERFLREGRMLAQLQHPSVIPVYDVGVSDEFGAYTVMRPARQGTLDEVVQARRSGNKEMNALWPLSRRLEIFARVCEGMAYAHSRGVVHLDIKPANILLGEFGEALISDWGVARILDAPEDDDALHDEELGKSRVRVVTRHGIVRGTPGYMSPEQMRAKEPAQAADIYGLGATLYALLTGVAPTTGRDFEAIQKATIEGRIVPPNQRRPDFDIPPELDAIVMKALATSPSKRYQTVAALQEDLDLFRRGYTPAAHSPGGVHRLRLLYRRQRTAVHLAALALLVIAGLSAGFINRLDQQREEAVTARQTAESSLLLASAREAEAKDLLKSLEAERNARLEQGRVLLPQMLREATTSMQIGNYKIAQRMADSAAAVDPNSSEAQSLSGDLALASMDMAKAAAAYRHGRSPLRSLVKLHGGINITKPGNRRRLYVGIWKGLAERKRLDLLAASAQLIPFSEMPLKEQMELRLELLKILNGKQNKWSPTFTIADETVDLDLSGHGKLASLDALASAPIHKLDISGTKVVNRSIVSTMPLHILVHRGATAESTRDLMGCSARVVDLSNSRTRWVNALTGLPMETLDVSNSKVVNFYPLLECETLKTVHVSSEQKKHAEVLAGQVSIIVVE
jgi:hypothetical protein